MKAVTFSAYGPVEVLRVEHLPDPEPGPNDVVVRVRACGLNWLDVMVRSGQNPLKLPMPHISGSEVAGEVAAMGSQVTGWNTGDRVAVAPYLCCGQCEYCLQGAETLCLRGDILGLMSQGGYAEFVKVPATALVPLPGEVDFVAAAALSLSALTAYHMIMTRVGLRPGELVLVVAAGSGVGSAAVQIARLAGARVIATAGSAEKAVRARELGADYTINHQEQDLLAEVRRITGKRGVDVVFEHVGAATWEKSVASLARGGRLVTCGALTGAEGKVNIWNLFAKEISLLGAYGGSRHELRTVLGLAAAGRLQPVIHARYPLEQAAAAQAVMEQRGQFGKIVLEVGA